MKLSKCMKSVFIGMVFVFVFGLTACSGDSGTLDRLNGKWDGGLFVIEFDADAKTMSAILGKKVEKQSFTVQSEDENSITIKIDNGDELIVTFKDDDNIVTLEKGDKMPWPFTRIK